MQLLQRLALSALAAGAAAGCSEVVYDGPNLTSDCRAGPCGIPSGGDGSYEPGRDGAIAAARAAAKVACRRLWSDCATLCDNPWTYCGTSESQCVEDYARSAVEDFTYPVYSDVLAAACADQLAERSCIDLDPNSPECESAVLEGCPNDDDGYGRPYSWLAAHDLATLPTTIRPHLCEGTSEWFAVHLEAGESLAVTLAGGIGSAWLNLYAPVGEVGGKQDVNDVGHSIHVDTEDSRQETELFDPVPEAGTYYLEIDLNRLPTSDLAIALGTDRRLPPSPMDVAVDTERTVYEALCRRLHGDCAGLCSEVDFYCGASESACVEAYARSAAEQLLDDGAATLDRNLAASCAADLSMRACGELGGASCGELLVGQCAADPAAYGRPFAGRMAPQLSLPATLDLNLCQEAPQYFRVDLVQRQRLVARTAQPPPATITAKLYLPTATDEELLNEDGAFGFSVHPDLEGDQSDAVPTDGTYWLTVEYRTSGPVTVTLE